MISNRPAVFHANPAITQSTFCIILYLWFYGEVTAYVARAPRQACSLYSNQSLLRIPAEEKFSPPTSQQRCVVSSKEAS